MGAFEYDSPIAENTTNEVTTSPAAQVSVRRNQAGSSAIRARRLAARSRARPTKLTALSIEHATREVARPTGSRYPGAARNGTWGPGALRQRHARPTRDSPGTTQSRRMDISRTSPRPSLERATGGVGSPLTVANAVTLARTALALVIGLAAVADQRPVLLAVAYVVYWLGDMADGWFARRLDQETRLGAVFDIVSDRACTAVLGAGLVAYAPEAAPAALVFLFSFLVLDTMLSLSFLCWPLLSPNYFARVDARVYVLNWSPVAKAVNTAGVIGALVLGATAIALIIAIIVVVIKVWSSVHVLRLLGALPSAVDSEAPVATTSVHQATT